MAWMYHKRWRHGGGVYNRSQIRLFINLKQCAIFRHMPILGSREGHSNHTHEHVQIDGFASRLGMACMQRHFVYQPNIENVESRYRAFSSCSRTVFSI